MWRNSVDTFLTSPRVYISQGYRSCYYAKRLQIQMNDKKFMFAIAPWNVNNIDSFNDYDVKHVKQFYAVSANAFKIFPR